MTKPFSILVTDGNSKHSIALQRYLRHALPEVSITAHTPDRFSFCSYQGGATRLCRESLDACLASNAFDMVIPVGGNAVRTVASLCPDKAALPPQSTIERCLDKAAIADLASELGVPHPRTHVVSSVREADALPSCFPVVIKARKETDLKRIDYANSPSQRHDLVRGFLERLPAQNSGLLLQEYVQGTGRGYFTICDRGRPVTAFMHERVRETPPTGGASTAARAIYDETLMGHASRLLSALKWHGPAMVEFKYDAATGAYNLIEINPKFWGSLELGLSAGINFGHILVRLFRGEHIVYCDRYDHDARFAWPLDGDLQTLMETRQLGRFFEYFQSNLKTNLFQSIRVDALKRILLFRTLIKQRGQR